MSKKKSLKGYYLTTFLIGLGFFTMGLMANNEATETIEVYTTQGVKVYEGTDNVISTNIDKDVMYVVRVGSYVAKIVVR